MHMPIQFDTLDYAKRLASAGVPTQQAEAHAAALGDVLGSAVVVHGELAALERNLLGEIKLVSQKVDTKFGALELKIDALELRLDTRIDALDLKLDTRIDALGHKFDTKLEALEQKFDARFDHSEQKFDARLERLDLRQGADMKHVYWMMSTLILLNLGILSKLMLQ
jgi:hypothetical protein